MDQQVQHRHDVPPEANTEQIGISSSDAKVKFNHTFISNGGNHQQKDDLMEEKVLILEENASLLETAL